jgi:alkylation response protein AidB-like acyl-CoA dehydrogenase
LQNIASEIKPFVDEREASGAFPAHELFKKLGDLGFLGLNNRCLPAILGRQGFVSETPVSRAYRDTRLTRSAVAPMR